MSVGLNMWLAILLFNCDRMYNYVSRFGLHIVPLEASYVQLASVVKVSAITIKIR
jgi:hypothetical protein